MPVNEARKDVRGLLAWRRDIEGSLLVEDAWRTEGRQRIHWWDALIVAAAQRHGCRYLLSEDFSAGAKFDDLEVVSPFERTPAQVLGP